jgi:hypothetical protein
LREAGKHWKLEDQEKEDGFHETGLVTRGL